MVEEARVLTPSWPLAISSTVTFPVSSAIHHAETARGSSCILINAHQAEMQRWKSLLVERFASVNSAILQKLKVTT